MLVVDDHPVFRRQLRRMLEAAGYSVVAEAPDGATAIEMAARTDPWLVLIDIGLPDMTGFEVASEIGPERVVLISGRDPRTFATELDSSQTLGFVSKSELTPAALSQILGQP